MPTGPSERPTEDEEVSEVHVGVSIKITMNPGHGRRSVPRKMRQRRPSDARSTHNPILERYDISAGGWLKLVRRGHGELYPADVIIRVEYTISSKTVNVDVRTGDVTLLPGEPFVAHRDIGFSSPVVGQP